MFTTSPKLYSDSKSIKEKFLLEEVLLEQNNKKFRTGDILLFAGSLFTQRCLRAILKTEFDHCSMIVRSDDKIWLWEADGGQGFKKGSRLIPLKVKLTNFKGANFFVHIPYVGVDIDQELLLESLKKNKDCEIHGKRGLIRYLLSDTIFGDVVNDLPWLGEGKFCSELIFETLMDVGIVKKDSPSRYSPKDLFYLSKYTRDKNSYGKEHLVYFQ